MSKSTRSGFDKGQSDSSSFDYTHLTQVCRNYILFVVTGLKPVTTLNCQLQLFGYTLRTQNDNFTLTKAIQILRLSGLRMTILLLIPARLLRDYSVKSIINHRVKKNKRISMAEIFKNVKYRGKHVILAGGEIFTAETGAKAAKILKKIRIKFPNETPEIAYLPKAHSLILWQ